MAAKQFNADVRSARNRIENAGIDGVLALERGDQDGEVVCTFIHHNLDGPIFINVRCVNLAGYPDDNNFLLSASTSDRHTRPAPAVTAALRNIENYTFGQILFESLRDIANGISHALEDKSKLDEEDDTVINDDEAAHSDAASDSGDDLLQLYSGEESSDDDAFRIPVDQGPRPNGRTPAKMAPGVLCNIKRDIRKCREAGAKIGILSGVSHGARNHVISLSIRARKLGISDEALEAWDVDPSDYIVLLLRVDEPYPTAQRLLVHPSSTFYADFRLGKCKRFKPSDESARRAFVAAGAAANSEKLGIDDRPFNKLFISNSLERFMNEYFFSMFKLRLGSCQTWDAANTAVQDMHVLSHPPDMTSEYHGSTLGKGKGKTIATSFSSESHDDHQTLPTILAWDSFAEAPENISMPLVALQFALHYFVRCTEYCLCCHKKVDKEFEALKPFVCQNPLCLFQYITMGFGPSVEHEILTQPYVVDLLVTLCYSSIAEPFRPSDPSRQVSDFGIRDFPTGLRLKVPSVPLPPPVSPHTTLAGATDPAMPTTFPKVEIRKESQRTTISVKAHDDLKLLKGGPWVVLRHWPHGDKGQARLVHAYIKSYDAVASLGEVELKSDNPTWGGDTTPYECGTYDMEIFLYDSDFDDLSRDGKAAAMRMILDTLPPISQLREWLFGHPHGQLRSFHSISPSAATLLEWIIASNRSCILQVTPVQDPNVVDQTLLQTIKTREDEAIPFPRNDYVQFRFAMGTPDKELRFHRALQELETQLQARLIECTSPTLFAWHGSPLSNWHSILRHGLDFNTINHGRAYGDGVYFSPQFHTSVGYMSRGNLGWGNSALRPAGVVALCEIINNPGRFRTTSPHYVVQQLDWIQCRYLFVQTGSTFISPSSGLPTLLANSSLPATTTNVATTTDLVTTTDPATVASLSVSDIYPQDPSCLVKGPGDHPLQIPRKALPSSRGLRGQPTKLTRASPKRAFDDNENGDDTDEEYMKDLDALFSDDEASLPSLKRFQPLVEPGESRNSSVDTIGARRLTTRRPLTPPKLPVVSLKTDFRPGTLDFNSIPRLALPEWANANTSRRLAAEIHRMQKVQADTPIHDLGWYIDFDKIENMFQWIVELHTFDPELPLARDMKKCGVTSIVLELRFGRDYPMSPPFVRVIRPQFLPFLSGGGGHVTIGGAICMEILTNTGWLPAMSPESVLMSVKMAMSSLDPQPARLLQKSSQSLVDYSPYEAVEAFRRFAGRHGWKVPQDSMDSASQKYEAR